MFVFQSECLQCNETIILPPTDLRGLLFVCFDFSGYSTLIGNGSGGERGASKSSLRGVENKKAERRERWSRRQAGPAVAQTNMDQHHANKIIKDNDKVWNKYMK